ncbi:MAG: phosphoadenylyl-sulfate reductase [Acidobacteria bacterium]|nr:phosphoadenylyl-sulfate reductase [Acidobacteriota bacterium]
MDRPAEQVLQWAVATFAQRFAIVTSFQKEGTILIDMAARLGLAPRVVTIDTGRLPAETLRMIDSVEARYGLPVDVLRPAESEVETMVTRFGSELFRESVAQRKLCCQVRKVRTLDRFLPEVDAYAVGLRRGQSESRENVEQIDGAKISPLAAWNASDVEEYLVKHNVPVHPLYAQGYTTIGCAPCSRAVRDGEQLRAGRWWWEVEGDKECGLHFSPEGKMERTVDVLLRDVIGTNA